ncbi:MAG: hypothetical protein NXI22_00900 [bacterium]|nr:hypothetical protein [bacterium]
MWRISMATLAILGSTSFLSVAFGQSISPESSLPNQLDWVRFEIIFGRVQPGRCNSSKSRTRNLIDAETGVRQSYRVSPFEAGAIIEYECVSDDTQLRMQYDAQSGLELHSIKEGVELSFIQPTDGNITVTVEPGGFQTEAAGLWRLAMQHPELVKLHLEPALQMLHKSWRIGSFVEQVERQLPRAARSSKKVVERDVKRLIRELGSNAFSQRREAQIALLELGPGIIPILDGIDRFDLNAEQTARLKTIREQLTPIVGDTPGRTAFFVAGDRTVWIALLNHDHRNVRLAAADHLANLCGESFPFDADAEGLARQIQFSRLRDTLAAGSRSSLTR